MKKTFLILFILLTAGFGLFASSITINLHSDVTEVSDISMALRYSNTFEGVQEGLFLNDGENAESEVNILSNGAYYFAIYSQNRLNLKSRSDNFSIEVNPDENFVSSDDMISSFQINYSGITPQTSDEDNVDVEINDKDTRKVVDVFYKPGITPAETLLGTFTMSWDEAPSDLPAGDYTAKVVVIYNIF